jgi:nucleoside-diphosphate-sugar epimerase
VEGDVCEAKLEPLFAGADWVVHLAAVTDAPAEQEARAEQVNVDGTARVAAACAAVGARLFFPSTTSVYGSTAAVVDEECRELRAQYPYTGTKLAAERLLAATPGLRFVVTRFGTIFGCSPGMRFHTAVNRFCWQAATGRPLTAWRTALHQLRPYLDLSDAVRAIGFLIERDLCCGRTYNVATTASTVNHVVSLIRERIPDLRVNVMDEAVMNDLSYQVSCERIRAHGFEFRGDLERGIQDTLDLLSGLS